MPIYDRKYRTLVLGLNLVPTISQVYYPDGNTLLTQFSSLDFDAFLQTSDIWYCRNPYGDWYLTVIAELDLFYKYAAEFYV